MQILKPDECVFCAIDQENIILETENSFSIFDKYPVSEGHILVIPKQHVWNFFDLDFDQIDDLVKLLFRTKEYLQSRYQPDAFNVGVNIGGAAGQTISHVHLHIIPRYSGDVEDPTGGVRAVIPGKAKYPIS